MEIVAGCIGAISVLTIAYLFYVLLGGGDER